MKENYNKSTGQAKKIGIGKGLQDKSKEEIKQLIFDLTEQKVAERFADQSFDREHEKIQLIGGEVFTIHEVKEIRKTLANQLQEYERTFRKEFYRQINRLKGWEKSDRDLYHKPPVVGRYTNELIYARFHEVILPILQDRNPYIAIGLRRDKHFQWLTPEGKKQLEGYIEDAIRVMKDCDTWYEFRIKYAKAYGLPIQLDAWEDNDKWA